MLWFQQFKNISELRAIDPVTAQTAVVASTIKPIITSEPQIVLICQTGFMATLPNWVRHCGCLQGQLNTKFRKFLCLQAWKTQNRFDIFYSFVNHRCRSL